MQISSTVENSKSTLRPQKRQPFRLWKLSSDLLARPSKFLESLVCKQLDAFLEHHNLLNNSQSGFRKGRSTELLLLHVTEKWRYALNQRKSIGIIFLDFQKAFDCVSHQLLPPKLQASGICNDALNWILEYIYNRNQYVSINGYNSTTMKIPSGYHRDPYLVPDFLPSLQMTSQAV